MDAKIIASLLLIYFQTYLCLAFLLPELFFVIWSSQQAFVSSISRMALSEWYKYILYFPCDAFQHFDDKIVASTFLCSFKYISV